MCFCLPHEYELRSHSPPILVKLFLQVVGSELVVGSNSCVVVLLTNRRGGVTGVRAERASRC